MGVSDGEGEDVRRFRESRKMHIYGYAGPHLPPEAGSK
jgi:hypothetical protein